MPADCSTVMIVFSRRACFSSSRVRLHRSACIAGTTSVLARGGVQRGGCAFLDSYSSNPEDFAERMKTSDLGENNAYRDVSSFFRVSRRQITVLVFAFFDGRRCLFLSRYFKTMFTRRLEQTAQRSDHLSGDDYQ